MSHLDFCYLKSVNGKTCESCSADFIRKPGMLTIKVDGRDQHYHADCFAQSDIGKAWAEAEAARKKALNTRKSQ